MNCIATIVSANYLAYAKSLADSIKLNHPGIDFKVLLVDRKNDETLVAANESELDIIFASDLNIPDFYHLAFKYDLVELNTALKPSFLKYILKLNYQNVIYLDPDIYVFDRLNLIFESLSSDDIVLTPHTMSPIMDGHRPSDIDFLRNGIFNLGFIALSNRLNSLKFLNWWEDRCLTFGFNDLGMGTFVDQKWIDLLPCYFDNVHILKHPGCNVAYWNLHERNISFKNSKYEVNGFPLVFFHFSGVKAENPKSLSRHQNRHYLDGESQTSKLVIFYCGTLIKNNHNFFKKINYTYGFFENGVNVTSFARRASCVPEFKSENPFSASSKIYLSLSSKKLISFDVVGIQSPNSMSFNQADVKVRIVNMLIRLLVAILGINRTEVLLRYAGILNRESNLARILFRIPLDFNHTHNKTRINKF